MLQIFFKKNRNNVLKNRGYQNERTKKEALIFEIAGFFKTKSLLQIKSHLFRYIEIL